MKNHLTRLALMLMVVLASCNRAKDDSETGAPDSRNAALELYCKYADNENLTVAYVGDLTLNGNKIDALMLQANDSQDWSQLKMEFGMFPKCDSLRCDSTDCNLSVRSENQKTISVGVGIDTDFIEELGLDTITDIGQVTDEQFDKMTEIIAKKISDIVKNFPVADTTLPTDAIIVGEGPVKIVSDGGMTLDGYINTLAQAIGNSILDEMIASKNQPIQDTNLPLLPSVDSAMLSARNSGHRGFVSAADDCNRTLWLFFYDNQEECNNILSHIKDDILVGSSQQEENPNN